MVTLKWQKFCSKVTFAWNRVLKHFLGKKSSYKCLNISFTVTEQCAHINICSYLGRFPLGKVGPYPSNGSQPAPQCVRESCWKSSSLCTCSGYTAHIWKLQSETRIIHTWCSNSTKQNHIMCPLLAKFMNTHITS